MKKNVRAMTECSIMVALSTVLSILKILELPYGGSVTVASALPVAIAVYRHGGAWGFGTALVNAMIQMLLGASTFSYFSTWQSLLALAVFDYVLAFVAFALVGVFKRVEKRQNMAMLFGVLLASVIRYLCHVISGATIWAGLSIPSEAALIYSLSYNATYMVPETIILALVTVYITSAIDFTRDIPTRIPTRALDKAEAYGYLGAGFSLLVGLIVATVLVFRELQDPDSGEFVITNIKNVNGVALLTVALVTLALCAACVVFARLRRARAQK